MCDTRLSKQDRHIVQHNISRNLITVLTLVEIITTDLLHKHHMTPELNLKTNQGVRDYAAALALHLNDGRQTHEAVAKCSVCMHKCLSTRWFEQGVSRGESKKMHSLFHKQQYHCLKVICNLGYFHVIGQNPFDDI